MRIGSSQVQAIRQGSQTVTAVNRGPNQIFSAFNFDPSSIEFFSRAGVTDFTAKTKIDGFVVYCKTAQFWDNLYCFPLSTSQNPNLQPLGGLVNLGVPVPGITLSGGVQPSANGLNFSPTQISRLAAFDINGSGLENATTFTMFVAAQIKSFYIPSRTSFFSAKNNSWSIGQPAANAGITQVLRNQVEYSNYTSGMFLNLHNLYCFSVRPVSTYGPKMYYRSNNNPYISELSLTLPATPLDSSFCIGSDGASALTTNGSYDGEISLVGVLKDYSLNHPPSSSLPNSTPGTNFYNQLKNNLLSQVLA